MKILQDKGIKPPFWTEREDSDRQEKFDEVVSEYGVDPRELWSLDYAFIVWIYQRLIMFLEDSQTIVDLEYHKFTVRDEVMNFKQCIEKMIYLLEIYLKEECEMSEEDAILDEFMDIFSKCWRGLWW